MALPPGRAVALVLDNWEGGRRCGSLRPVRRSDSSPARGGADRDRGQLSCRGRLCTISAMYLGHQMGNVSDEKLQWVAQLGVEHIACETREGIEREDATW